MDEQQPVEKPEAPKEKAISSSTGILIIIIILLVGTAAYFMLKARTEKVAPAPATSQEQQPAAVTETAPKTLAGEATAEQQAADAAAQNSQSAVNFNYELGQLDAQANSASADDFRDSGATDAQFGL